MKVTLEDGVLRNTINTNLTIDWNDHSFQLSRFTTLKIGPLLPFVFPFQKSKNQPTYPFTRKVLWNTLYANYT